MEAIDAEIELAICITEGIPVLDMVKVKAALKNMARCQALGVGFAIDDFGTGFSSLTHLRQLPVNLIKIDQSFVRELDDHSEDSVIVRSTIEMSHSLGLKVVAEGVELAPSLSLLQRWHCDTAQGYLISRPLAAAAFEAWLAQPYHSPLAKVH
jgi:EAL domain-containing protein (putative c-di-GMP-specific phosphodiesterase class I)